MGVGLGGMEDDWNSQIPRKTPLWQPIWFFFSITAQSLLWSVSHIEGKKNPLPLTEGQLVLGYDYVPWTVQGHLRTKSEVKPSPINNSLIRMHQLHAAELLAVARSFSGYWLLPGHFLADSVQLVRSHMHFRTINMHLWVSKINQSLGLPGLIHDHSERMSPSEEVINVTERYHIRYTHCVT